MDTLLYISCETSGFVDARLMHLVTDKTLVFVNVILREEAREDVTELLMTTDRIANDDTLR